MEDSSLQRILILVSYYTSVPVERLGPHSRAENTPGWDSVANLGLLGAIEEEFGVTFTTDDAMRLRTAGELANFVAIGSVGAGSSTG